MRPAAAGREPEEKLTGGDGDNRAGEDAADSLRGIVSSTAQATSLVRCLHYGPSPLCIPRDGAAQGKEHIALLRGPSPASLCWEPGMAALLRAKPGSPPLLMPLLKPINPCISAGIFLTGAVQ